MLNSAKAGPIAKRVAEDITATMVQLRGSDLIVLAAAALHDHVVQVGGLLGVDHDVVAGAAMESGFAAANFDALGLHHGAAADPETRDSAKLNGGHLATLQFDAVDVFRPARLQVSAQAVTVTRRRL